MSNLYLLSPALGLAQDDINKNGIENSKIRQVYRNSSPMGYVVDSAFQDVMENGKDSIVAKGIRTVVPILNLIG